MGTNTGMTLSLSVRIAEGFLSKEEAILPLEEVARIAGKAGYTAICMRASQVGVHSNAETAKKSAALLRERGLDVSMMTGDFDIVYNNSKGPDSLDRITPFLDLAETLGAPLLRVALKNPTDIPRAQDAADEAASRGLKLAHQCHTLSLFETVESIEQTLQAIDRPNFGLIFEPANLELCGQYYGTETISRLSPWIFNVYLQNHSLKPNGGITLDTWCRGPSSFDLIPIHEDGGIDFPTVFSGLKSIDYTGTITVHQSATDGEAPMESAQKTADYLKSLF